MPTRRWGPERNVSTTITDGPLSSPRVATLVNGGYVIVWQDYTSASPTIRARVFNALGAPTSGEIIIATNTYNASDVAIAGLANGGFYVTWSDRVSPDEAFIQGNVYTAAGTFVRYQPVIFDFAIDANPEMTRLGSGTAVLWEDFTTDRLGLRIFDALGNGGVVTTDVSPGVARAMAVGSNPDASRVAVAWESNNDIIVKVYDPVGAVVVGATRLVESTATTTMDEPSVAWASRSVFALAWTQSDTRLGTPTTEVFIQWYRIWPTLGGSSSVPVTPAIQLSSLGDGPKGEVRLTGLPNGGIVAAWWEGGVVRLQAFDAAATKVGGVYLLTQAGAEGSMPDLAALSDGRVVATWIDADDLGIPEVHTQIIDPRDGIVTGSSNGDTLYGNDQVNDEISGLGGNDTLFGLRGDDVLFGGMGDDTLNGGLGADDMHGGKGADLFIIDQDGDQVFEDSGAGIDTVSSDTIDLQLTRYLNVENITLTGSRALFAIGSLGANVLNGASNSAANQLTGRAGNDTYIVGAGDTIVELSLEGTDTVSSALISLSLASYANVENIVLTGGLALSATGDAGANVIDGSQNSAANVLTGLGGDDTFIVDALDTVIEAASGGNDTIRSAAVSLDLALYPQVENLVLLGALALFGTGTDGANALDGAQNIAANVLTGLGGNDVYTVGPGDTVVEAAGGGTDTVESALIDVDLGKHANVEQVVLRGSLALKATGSDAANYLNGAFTTAANVLTGLGGDDTYYVGIGDTVVEAINAGFDTVQSSSVSLDLAAFANVENIVLVGTAALNATGNKGANLIDGARNSGANVLTGLGGSDTYVIGAGDTIVEAVNGGNDTVQSAEFDLNLANYANVENVVLRGTAALAATGNSGGNLLDGAGSSEANVLTGLGGDDTYIVGAGDIVVEAVGGGFDVVFAAASYTLVEGAEVEVLRHGASSATTGLSLFGNALASTIIGGAGRDTLSAGGGGDILVGNGGLDTLLGGSGADTFRFIMASDSTPGSARDVIRAFNGNEGDRIDLTAIDANDLLAGDQLFAWRDTGAFTGAAGELRYSVFGTECIVQGTISGAGLAFEIRVAGVTSLSASDFRL